MSFDTWFEINREILIEKFRKQNPEITLNDDYNIIHNPMFQEFAEEIHDKEMMEALNKY